MQKTPPSARDQQRTEHRWPDPSVGPWQVLLIWSEIDGRPECAGVSVTAADAGELQPIGAGVLRQIPFGDLIAADRAALAPPVVATGGMRKSAAARLKLAADIYQEAIRTKSAPTKAVAEHFGISQGGASNLVARARAAGLLPPTSAGKAVG